MNFTSTAKNLAIVTAFNTTTNGGAKIKVTSLALEFTAIGKADLKGAIVKVIANGTMNIEGLVATIRGQLTTSQGSLVKIG